MSDTTGGSYRVAAPAHQAYDTSPGEQMVLRGLDANNLGALYGVLLNQRALAGSSQQQYSRDLGAANRVQEGIARARMLNDDRESQRKAIGNLVQHGNLPSSVAMNGLDLTGLPAFLSSRQAAAGTIGADNRRATLDDSKALEQSGSGLYHAAQAGVNPTPGQQVGPGAAGNVSLQRQVGTPLSIRAAEIKAAGDGGGANTRLDVSFDPETGQTLLKGRATSVSQLMDIDRQLREASAARQRAGTSGAGGNNLNPEGATPTGGRNTGPGAPAPRVTNPSGGNGRPAITAPLTTPEIASIRRMEQQYGKFTGHERRGDGRLIGRFERGTAEVK